MNLSSDRRHYARDLQFEKAAQVRDQLARLKLVMVGVNMPSKL